MVIKCDTYRADSVREGCYGSGFLPRQQLSRKSYRPWRGRRWTSNHVYGAATYKGGADIQVAIPRGRLVDEPRRNFERNTGVETCWEVQESICCVQGWPIPVSLNWHFVKRWSMSVWSLLRCFDQIFWTVL